MEPMSRGKWQAVQRAKPSPLGGEGAGRPVRGASGTNRTGQRQDLGPGALGYPSPWPSPQRGEGTKGVEGQGRVKSRLFPVTVRS